MTIARLRARKIGSCGFDVDDVYCRESAAYDGESDLGREMSMSGEVRWDDLRLWNLGVLNADAMTRKQADTMKPLRVTTQWSGHNGALFAIIRVWLWVRRVWEEGNEVIVNSDAIKGV